MWSYFRPWKAGDLDIPGFVREAKRAGAEGVELLDFFYKNAEAERPLIKAALEETGLPVAIFSVAQNFAKAEPAQRIAELEKIKFGVDEALFYGAGVVRVFAGDVAEGITYDDARHWIIEGLSFASEYAHARGIDLALENHGTLAGKGDQVAELIDDVRARAGNDALGANPDTGNFLLIDPPSHLAVAKVAPFAKMVHFKDFRYAQHPEEGFAYGPEGKRFVGTALGEGEVDLGACIAALKNVGFDGWLSLEYEGEEDPFTAVPRSLEIAKRFL
jgi:sugar phosphate isomerase/epimerase